MTRRKRIYTNAFATLDEAVAYIKRVKDINGKSVEVEMNELCGGWCVKVWWIR